MLCQEFSYITRPVSNRRRQGVRQDGKRYDADRPVKTDPVSPETRMDPDHLRCGRVCRILSVHGKYENGYLYGIRDDVCLQRESQSDQFPVYQQQ